MMTGGRTTWSVFFSSPSDVAMPEVQPAMGQQDVRRDDAVLLVAHFIPRQNNAQFSPAG